MRNGSSTNPPTVSIIVPVHDRLELLDETLDSIRGQTYRHTETIIVDDGSAPSAARALDALADPRVRIIHQPNQGLACARNTALAHARGRFIQFLDSDDLLHPRKLSHDVNWLERHPDVDLITGPALRFTGSTRSSRPVDSAWPFREFLPAILAGNPMPVHAPLLRRAVLPPAPHFDPALSAAEDWDFWLTLALRGARAAFVPGARTYYRSHPDQMSSSAARMVPNVAHVLSRARSSAPRIPDNDQLRLHLICGHAAWAVRARAADLEDDAAQLGKHVAAWLADLPADAAHPDFPAARLLEVWTHVGFVVAHDPPLLRDAAARWRHALDHWTARPDPTGLRILLGAARLLHQSGVDELQRLADLARQASLVTRTAIKRSTASRGYAAHVDDARAELARCGIRRLMLFGAGAHTDWLLADFRWRALDLVAIIDDDQRLWGTRVLGIPVVSIRDAANIAVDAVLISSDAHEDHLARRAALMLPDLPIFKLYEPARQPEPVAPL